jgi:hypothetical protein
MRSTRTLSRPPGVESLRLVLRLLLGGLITLWVLDVVVNLQLVTAPFVGNRLLGSPSDFIGLLIGDVQIAAAAAIPAWLFGLSVGLLARRADRDREAVAALAALMVAVAVLARSPEWSFVFHTIRAKLAFAAVAGLVTCGVVRLLMRARRPGPWGASQVVQWVLLPTLAVGLSMHALKQEMHGSQAQSVVAGVAAAAVLAVGLFALRARPGSRLSKVVWLPVLGALLLAAYSWQGFRTCGAYDYEATPRRVSAERPHVFLIVLDTVRADHMRCYGYGRDTMPALEEWARGGVTAARAISPAGWTAPAHASIFSGRTVSGHGIHSRSGPGDFAGPPTAAREGVSWLPELLGAEGYHCLAVSANAIALPEDIKGFDRVVIPRRDLWLYTTVASRVDQRSPLSRNLSERMRWRMPYVDARGIAEIVPRAAPDDDRPLFVFVNFLDAHSPYNPPRAALLSLGAGAGHAFNRYEQHRSITQAWDALPDTKAQYLADLYDGELRWIDMNLATLLDWIDERYGGNAVVIVTSDHGEELGEEKRVGHEYGLSQRLIHVPLFLRGPGLRSGELADVVSTRSLFGFILACARGETPGVGRLLDADEDGLISERYPSTINAQLLGAAYKRPWVSLIDAGYKVVGPSSEGLELYDIEEGGFDREVTVPDPLQEAALGTRIDEYWEESRDTRASEEKPLSEGEEESLRSLGYLD